MSYTKNIATEAPHFGAWSDLWVTGCIPSPPKTKLKGLNFFNLCFWLVEKQGLPWHGAYDQAKNWEDLAGSQKDYFLEQLANLHEPVSLAATAFGDTDKNITKVDATVLAGEIASWVKSNKLNRLDINFEEFSAFDSGKAEPWLIEFTKELRTEDNLPMGKYIITHCPIAPWFRNDNYYPGGGYTEIHNKVGNLIDWYNVQFFNQEGEYDNIDSLLFESKIFPKTSLFEIAEKGVPLSKLVIGKPASPEDATHGYMKPNMLAEALQKAKEKGWNGGVVTWQFPSKIPGIEISQWMETVRALSWPLPPQDGDE